MQMGPAGECQPLNCAKAMGCIEGVRNPSITALEMTQLRGELLECAPCLHAFDLEVKLRVTMSPSMSELPTADFRARITQTLASIDLSQIDVTDL